MPESGQYEWPPASDLADRFSAKVVVGAADECWSWQAFRNRSGYGMIRNGHCMALAHRVAWVLEHGRIPLGKHVLHHCDNPACCNPRHLYIGTNADNVRDKVGRDRMPKEVLATRGEKHWNARLTWDQVNEIRASSTGRIGEGAELADRFGVSRATICNILKGKVWK